MSAVTKNGISVNPLENNMFYFDSSSSASLSSLRPSSPYTFEPVLKMLPVLVKTYVVIAPIDTLFTSVTSTFSSVLLVTFSV